MRTESIRRHLQAALIAVLVAATSLMAAAGLSSRAEAAVVSRIVVEGNQRVDAETIRAYLVIRPGVEYSRRDEDESLKALFDTGLFSDVRFDTRGVALFVIVVENPVINEVAFEGNRRFKDDQLISVVQSQPRGVLTRAKVQSDVARILELYRRRGRFQASVNPQIIELANNRANLVFVITEGPKTGVAGISFIGNNAFGDGRLRSVIATRRSGILSFIRPGGTYDPDRLAADEETLKRYYLDRGFADFQVISSVADLDRERNAFFIAFTLSEGPRYRYGEIRVDSTIPGVDPAVLERQVLTRQGHIFSATEVEQSLEEITLYLAANGYPFVNVRPRIHRDPDLLEIGITFVVDEGTRVYVGRIEIRGNTRTRDYVIRREFDIAEGDAYNRVLVDRAERRLRRLGYFAEVRIFTEPGATDDRVDIIVEVTEEPTGELSFGIGYSTSDGAVGDVSLTEKNFLGRGYNLRVALSAGTSARTYEFGFTDPYFLGRRISAGFNVFRRQYSENSFRSYDYDTTGGGITFGFPITETLTVQTGYKLEVQDIGLDAGDCDGVGGDDVSLAICSAAGETWVSSAFYSVIYDSLDNRQDPHDGIYFRFTQEVAGLGGDVRYLKTTSTSTYYHELLADRDIVGLVRVQGGHIVGLGQSVRILDAFMKGGETVRGFESSGIGPRDAVTDDALGGNVYVAGTAEIQFPFPLLPPDIGFKGAVFADAGTLFDTDATVAVGTPLDTASLRSSLGGSILWASPLGPLRADFAYVLTSESYDKKQFFRFGGGTRF